MTKAMRIGIACGGLLLAGIAGTAYNFRRTLHIFSDQTVGGNPFEAGQCTWYALARAKEAGWTIRFDQSYGRNARDWPFRVTNANFAANPAAGEVMVLGAWHGNPYGHVAYVESVTDKDHWTVSHANMLAGSDYGLLNGKMIRLAKVARKGSSVLFEGNVSPLPLAGFLVRQGS